MFSFCNPQSHRSGSYVVTNAHGPSALTTYSILTITGSNKVQGMV